MADENRKQFTVEELATVFNAPKRLAHRCILMGGQTDCHWASRFLPFERAIKELERRPALVSRAGPLQAHPAAPRRVSRPTSYAPRHP